MKQKLKDLEIENDESEKFYNTVIQEIVSKLNKSVAKLRNENVKPD